VGLEAGSLNPFKNLEKMEEKFSNLLLVVFTFILLAVSCTVGTEKEEVVSANADTLNTTLAIYNAQSDSVLTYLTLGGGFDSTFVQDVNGIFGITDSGLVGSFYLPSQDTVFYQSSLKFSGNIGFGSQGLNCFTTSWPTGVNIFEFNLNEEQESADISAIGGVNSIMTVQNIGGPVWAATPSYPNVRLYYNDTMWKNTNLVGVYPYGCTACTDTTGKQGCQTPNETPSSHAVCNPTRAAGDRGGVVLLTFKGYTNVQICEKTK
jgi:hypothetical protein